MVANGFFAVKIPSRHPARPADATARVPFARFVISVSPLIEFIDKSIA
jgi:hypothetical protein